MNVYDTAGTANMTATGMAIQQSPASVAQGQREELEKALHHLSGKVSELRERIKPVLMPERTAEVGGAVNALPAIDASPAANHLFHLKLVAREAIREVEDILNRLDV